MMSNSKFESFMKRVCETTGLNSQSELASTLKVSRSTITHAKNKGEIPERWIWKLSRAFRLNPDWLESGVGEPFQPRDTVDGFMKVPKVRARLSAGGGSFEVAHEVEDFFMFRTQWLRKKGTPDTMVLMTINGNSMEPELYEGDIVLVDQSQTKIYAGAIYALGIEDTIMVKRLEKLPNKLVLRSTNPSYDPIYLDGDERDTVRIIGKVTWLCRSLN
jgi:phage repressor protein C with HTH and peptisase S24 domain